jgi:hypothetical protein
MENSSNLMWAVLVSHAVLIPVQYLVKRFTTLPRLGDFGIYILLLPIGFNLFGSEFPPWFIASTSMFGLSIVLFSLRRKESDKECLSAQPGDDT